MTRSFSETTCRPAGDATGPAGRAHASSSAGVTSRRRADRRIVAPRSPRRRPRTGSAARCTRTRRGAAATRCGRPRGVDVRRAGRPAASRASDSRAARRRRRRRTPTRTGPSARSARRRSAFSARWQIRASSSGRRPAAASSRSAQAEASSIAADDDSPAFAGRVEAITPAQPVPREPGLAERPGRAGDVVEPRPGARAGRSSRSKPSRSPVSRRVSSTRRSSVGQVGDPDLEVDRGREHEAEVVVGVLADEVDPPRGPDDADLGPSCRRGRIDRHQGIGEPGRVEDGGLGHSCRVPSATSDRIVASRQHS